MSAPRHRAVHGQTWRFYAIELVPAAGAVQFLGVVPSTSPAIALDLLRPTLPPALAAAPLRARPCDADGDPFLAARVGWHVYRHPDMARCPGCGKKFFVPEPGNIVAVRLHGLTVAKGQPPAPGRQPCPHCHLWLDIHLKPDAETVTLALGAATS